MGFVIRACLSFEVDLYVAEADYQPFQIVFLVSALGACVLEIHLLYRYYSQRNVVEVAFSKPFIAKQKI